ncbi:malonyl-ACP O-methyltransferase BioC [Paenibacillus sp. NEAU-GSW1]|uniref:malonyl-ACP O-methyltransferase BioC n=1 Tax=Paenibacillus sp. NEAU-GSW1 TaxID=2682486 RepID=UPI0012E1F7D6|nr:malonyl-ACP O-methyltransferase BioC [Paenibacillus sp. NEAU-GSW1]MUT67953.1 malonyl-ACP O-methyltransferase BioC [Paenibacillus sp. NEAU-GSW1]
MADRKASIGRQFDRSAAGSYDAHALVQRQMASRLAASFNQWASSARKEQLQILEIGCGTGALTEMLVNHWPNAAITALDLAPAMLRAAETRILQRKEAERSNVRFLLADAEIWSANAPASSFDLIVSNACFQWLSDPQQTLGALRRLLRPGGLLAFATFGPDTFRELHAAFDEVYCASGLEPKRHGLTFQSANEWGEKLREAGFSAIQHEQYDRKEEYATAREFLRAVKGQGASASEAATGGSHGSRRLFASMFKEYESRFSTPGGVSATYEVIIMQAMSGGCPISH